MASPPSREVFRAGVGAVVAHRDGRVLAGERAATPGAWQLPQGGLDPGEDPRAGVLRELREETGIDGADLTLLDEHPDWLVYELPPELRTPKRGRGQAQRWFLFRFTGDDRSIDVAGAATPEFRAWRWMPLAELAESTAPFRRPLYRVLLARFGAMM